MAQQPIEGLGLPTDCLSEDKDEVSIGIACGQHDDPTALIGFLDIELLLQICSF